VHGILRWTMAPVMRGWAANLERKFAGVPQPLDAPQVHSPGRDSHRLPGSLARALTARTGRGTGVDVTARSSMTVRTAHRHIDFDTLRRYDAVVLTLGIGDAGQLTSPRAWLHDLARLVERIQLSTVGGTEIYLAGIVALSSLPMFQTPLGALAGAQARALNRASIAYCAQQDGVSYVRLPATVASPSGRFRSATDYEVWADALAAQMVDALPQASGSAGERHDAALPIRTAEEIEDARHRALLTLNLLDTAPEERFDRIVALASSTLGTSAAAFTVLDGDRQWHKSVVGLQRNCAQQLVLHGHRARTRRPDRAGCPARRPVPGQSAGCGRPAAEVLRRFPDRVAHGGAHRGALRLRRTAAVRRQRGCGAAARAGARAAERTLAFGGRGRNRFRPRSRQCRSRQCRSRPYRSQQYRSRPYRSQQPRRRGRRVPVLTGSPDRIS
jgi:hypothetical protein